MNEVLKVLKERRSIRAFPPGAAEKGGSGRHCGGRSLRASAKNLQSTKLVVVRDAAVLARLERLNGRILGTPEGTPFTVRRRPLWCCPTASIPTGSRTVRW
ncbi:MAG: hypothetical protein ACLU38_12030 [Dysosmobacter sp.]